MQPPPQAVPPGAAGPPPAGSPHGVLWAHSPYRRRAGGSAATPAACPPQPVTDPFVFSRQSRAGLPGVQGPVPSGLAQYPGVPVPHTDAGDSSQAPWEPPPGPLAQPRADASLFASVPASVLPGPEMNRGAELGPGSEPGVQILPYPPHCIPGVGPDEPRGAPAHENMPRLDYDPHASVGTAAAAASFPQPCQQGPEQWGLAQGGPRPAGQRHSPCSEGSLQNAGILPLPLPPGQPRGPGPEQHSPAPAAGDGRKEPACPQGRNHSAHGVRPESAFGQHCRVANTWANQELRQNPGVSGAALVNTPAQGNSPQDRLHCAPGAGPGWTLPEADSGALSMFFRSGETENEENLSSEQAGYAGTSAFDGLSPSPGLGHPAAGATHQAFLKGPHGEGVQQRGDTRPYFPQPEGIQPDAGAPAHAARGALGDAANAERPCAGGSRYDDDENLEFAQNQEVLPSEPPSLADACLGDPFRFGPLPGCAVPRPGTVGLPGGEGANLEAPDAASPPVRPDGLSCGYSGASHGRRSGSARPQEPAGTFIQQEVGKPEEEAAGSFFQQIDSSPVGGETADGAVRQGRRGGLGQPPSTPSPPKPVGVFQTSANSSFEPVKSHLVGVRPVEADRANVVGEVRETPAHQKCKPAATPPDASPGNLEQPPDNMETLFAPQVGLPPLSASAEAGHVLPPPGAPSSQAPEKRPSARAQGAAKCESPATTLWAQNELPDFGGNVLLAPAAPALYVPAAARPAEVLQPPEEGPPGPPPRSRAGPSASENLENPPRAGEEEALPPQASCGYASLLSSLPTESLQNRPVLIAQPDHSYHLAQPVTSSLSPPNANEKQQSWGDALLGDRCAAGGRALGADSGDSAAVRGIPVSSAVGSAPPGSLSQGARPQGSGASEVPPSQPAGLLVQPPSHPAPKNSAPESRRSRTVENVSAELGHSPGGGAEPPLGPADGPASHCSNQEEPAGALDFTLSRTSERPDSSAPQPRQPGVQDPGRFYQQVMADAQEQPALEGAQRELGPPQHQVSPPQVPKAALSEPPSNPESPPGRGRSQHPVPSPAAAGQPPPSSSASVVPAGSSQTAVRSEQPWLQPNAFGPPPQALASYYYYRPLFEAYPPPYPSPYAADPGTAALYYQDVYGLYEPRYRPYDSAANAYAEAYRYPEPERPSSRASHCSDRPAARPGYPEGYFDSKSGWSSQSDYYANYYSSQYDYGDLGRWDRYHYSSRLRDARAGDRRYWQDAECDPCGKESCAYGGRPEKCDDYWRYDPRVTGSFDDDPEPPRDPYGEEADRRSVHSEHSARSLRSVRSLQSRRSSLSAHSHQSQLYRSHAVMGDAYEAPPAPGSFHGDYGYGTYGGNGSSFPEYSWPAMEQVPSRPSSPEKFPVPHLCARFGPGGQLIRVMPNLPSEGQPALVEIHSMETLLQHTPEQEELRAFPGPLGKDDTHKVDVINFAQNKAAQCLQSENLVDKESAGLLWDFVVLLCRQNGTVVGTDLAELLLRDHRTVWLPGKSPSEANLIDFTNEVVEQVEEEPAEAQLSFLTDSQTAAAGTLDKETERFRELLLYGRKKDALESAMKNGLWGHALLLASKMDSRTHARVMTRFANSLPINDPLQTVYQLLSGRMPAASTCCGDEKWGDWRPHLAMVLSNLNNNTDVEARTMVTMGDTLASKGLLDAAHFCYLMAQVGFGVYTKKTTKLVLIGSNHSWPFLKFATNEAIQRTEAYEYAQSLGAQSCALPSFQVFKFIYSCRLAELGLATQAFHYCEVIAKSILAQPHQYSLVLVSQLAQVASQLRLFDPQLKEKPEEEALVEPEWLARLRRLEEQMKEGTSPWSWDGAGPQRCPSTPASEAEPSGSPALSQPAGLGTDNPLLAPPPVPGAEHSGQGVRLLPSAPQVRAEGQLATPASVLPAPGPLEPGPSYGPPGPALGFPEPPRPDPTALYLGPGVSSGTPSLPDSTCLPQEPRSQDPGILLQGAPARSSLTGLREDFGAEFQGSLRTAPDSEAPMGWDRADAASAQPPPPVTPAPETKRPALAVTKQGKEEKKSESWFSRWLSGKRRVEAYLPDDKNKSIVWDEKKNQWVNLNEPEEERKAPPPPPTAAAPPGPGNVFSRKAVGPRARYVDVLNPGGAPRTEPALAPADLFAPLAPLPIPANLFVPNPDAEEPQPLDGAGREGQAPAGDPGNAEPALAAKVPSGTLSPPGSELPLGRADGSQGGELSRCSSLSSLSREVSQHFPQPPVGGAPSGPVPFYNPAQLAQAPAVSGSSRPGRIGQRKYPPLN
ncbi:protein transport protein Sec16A isoform X1 [Lepus europaeus]|uniref:protein transport protein Sec16A isoform X1 n=1 Tax=Lepus europaeus TaxID=9983 RepID=UPI002B466E36|nr:protein transport protein Sec16A isoform X1 [Lepus europaeus]XP_062063239.1 protein transport protein Sec16A isoform X1 [Lepus europaeus]XP_062063240.1 protein transport protein Sec16A isoform X1 [Lepus europaeus]